METTQNTTPQATAPTMAQQISSLQTDSQVPAAAAPVVQASPVAPEVPSQQQAPPVVQDPDSAAKLVEAEKRIRDTQNWGHQKAQEAAQLRNQLNALFNDPRMQQIQQVVDGRGAAPATPVEAAQDLDLKRAWLEYQSSPNDEAAFGKLLQLAEERASRKTMDQVQTVLQRREAEAAIKQRNIQAAETINKTVSELAPDVPLELFWAMSGRAEMETPANLTDYGQRLEWQVERAVALSRGALQARIAQLQQNRQQQQAVTQQAAAIMPAGGAAPVAGTMSSPRYPTLVDAIRTRQEAQYRR
jgi:hypothetical protein